MPDKMKCAVAGLLTGALNGFFGAGGGMLLVPLLIRWVRLEERRAFATSVFIIAPLCVVSAAVYLFRAGINPAPAVPYLVGGLAGGFIGGRIFNKIPTSLLHRIFGLLLLYGGLRSIFA